MICELSGCKNGGWYRDRTCDPYHVKVMARRIIERFQSLPMRMYRDCSRSVHVNHGHIMGAFSVRHTMREVA